MILTQNRHVPRKKIQAMHPSGLNVSLLDGATNRIWKPRKKLHTVSAKFAASCFREATIGKRIWKPTILSANILTLVLPWLATLHVPSRSSAKLLWTGILIV